MDNDKRWWERGPEIIGHYRDGRPIFQIAGGDGRLDTLLEEERTIVERTTPLMQAWESGERELTEEERTQLGQDRERLSAIRGERGELEATIRTVREAGEDQAAREEALRAGQRRNVYGEGAAGAGNNVEPFTLGEIFTESDAYRSYLERFPEGGPSEAMTAFSSRIPIQAFRSLVGLPTATEQLRSRLLSPARLRALVTAADTSAGDLVRPDFLGLLEPGLTRPLTIRDLLTVIPTTSDAIEYVKEVSRTAAAAITAEATAATGTSGTKPEGGLVFDVVETTIKTIAVWVPVTRRILADAMGLRAYIDSYLLDDVAQELEDQVVAGNGGANFTGILNTTGIIDDIGAPASGESVLHTVRRAKRRIIVEGRTRPTAVLFHPADSEKVDLIQINDEVNHFAGAGPFNYQENQPLWGVRRVESEAVPEGTFLMGDFRRAILFDRESTTISVGTINDDFIRNIVRVLAEGRWGFGVVRPKAFAIGEVP